LLDEAGKPWGGQWTYDADNRLKFPKGRSVPIIQLPGLNEYVKKAQVYIQQNFPANYGSVKQPFDRGFYPTTYAEADAWLTDFLTVRFTDFGAYEDAIVAEETILHHSVLLPLLNIGLLSPQQIIDRTLDLVDEVPLNSLEGFVRQIMGWREFIRITSERRGRSQRSRNYWGFTRPIPESFWTGNTGILPLDSTIQKTIKSGYCHHIERLMVVGNFMLLCEFDPDEVYRWFMEMFVLTSSQPPSQLCLPYSNTNIKPTTTGEMEKGRSIILKTKAFPGKERRVTVHAAQRPKITLRGTAIAVKVTVNCTANKKLGRVKFCKKGSKPL
jgi:deoxyribodipyrimidine photolyase-related protein